VVIFLNPTLPYIHLNEELHPELPPCGADWKVVKRAVKSKKESFKL